MADRKKTTEGSIPTRALAGTMQGVRDQAAVGMLGMGVLPLMPFIRRRALSSQNVPKAFQAGTEKQLGDLTKRLLIAAGRKSVTEEGYPIVVNPVLSRAGHAEFIREVNRPGGKPLRDIIRLSLGVAPETVAHEVGHATTGGRAGKALRALSMRVRGPLATAAPSVLALSGALSDGETPVHAKAAPWVGGGILAAILGEEARANIRGANALKSLGYDMTLKKRLKMFMPTATYLGKAGLLVGAPLGIAKGLDYYNELQRKGRPMRARDLMHASPEALASLPSKSELQDKWEPDLGKNK